MELSQSQKEQLANWVERDLKLSEVQRLIESEWGQKMTYMDVRFLLDDCKIDLKAPEPAPEESTPDAPQEAELLDDAAASVQVSVDKVMRPGAMVSGDVTFSDGEKATWQLDQMGRIGLVPKTEGYRPSQEDLAIFQQELQGALQKSGF